MQATFIVGMLIVCPLIILAAWVIDGIQAAIETRGAARCSEGPKVGQGRVKSRTAITLPNRGRPAIQPHEHAILDIAVMSMHDAIRHVSARILEGPGTLVQFHGVHPVAGPAPLTETLSVNLSDLLAARASDHLGAALEGDPRALRAFEQEAERLLEADDIELLV
jgi:hypothetical protein